MTSTYLSGYDPSLRSNYQMIPSSNEYPQQSGGNMRGYAGPSSSTNGNSGNGDLFMPLAYDYEEYASGSTSAVGGATGSGGGGGAGGQEWSSIRPSSPRFTGQGPPSMLQGMGMGMLPPPSAILNGIPQVMGDSGIGVGDGTGTEGRGYYREPGGGGGGGGGAGGGVKFEDQARRPGLNRAGSSWLSSGQEEQIQQQAQQQAQHQHQQQQQQQQQHQQHHQQQQQQQHQQQQQQQQQQPQPNIRPKRSHKRQVSRDDEDHPTMSAAQHGPSSGPRDRPGAASEFIKKLYSMLSDPQSLLDKIRESSKQSFGHQWLAEVVGWTEVGSSFQVKDLSAFSNWVLPSLFRHCNFASFVRQLNKYGFNKVKYTNQRVDPGDTRRIIWEFEHPGFRRDGADALDLIKRKITQAKKKSHTDHRGSKSGTDDEDISDDNNGDEISNPAIHALFLQMEAMDKVVTTLHGRLRTTEMQLDQTRREVGVLRQREEQRDTFWPELISYAVGLEKQLIAPHMPSPSPSALRLVNRYNDILRSFGANDQLLDPLTFFHAHSQSPLTYRTVSSEGTPDVQIVNGYTRGDNMKVEEGMLGGTEMVLQGSYGSVESASGSVTVGSGNASFNLAILPDQIITEDDAVARAGNAFDPSGPASPCDDLVVPAADQHGQIITVPRKPAPKQNLRKINTATPWQMAPRVLVVEDDNVSRLLSAKILQLIGCKADMVSDGPAAVEMMGQNQYDLCLMDINLPSLSGTDATTMIRRFDFKTPIISMTSGAPQNVVDGYLSVGMNDYLPKPFNRIELFQMLQKHLHHLLLNFRRMSHEIPPLVGIPPLSDNGLQEAIAIGVASLRQDSWDLNGNLLSMNSPVAAMGISDDQYTGLVQSYYFSNSPVEANATGMSVNHMFAQGGPFFGAFDVASNPLLKRKANEVDSPACVGLENHHKRTRAEIEELN